MDTRSPSRWLPLVLVALACESTGEPTKEQAQPHIAPMQRSFEPVAEDALAGETPDEVFARMEAELRLEPDRRFRDALGRLGVFAGEAGEVTVQWRDGAFDYRVGDGALGRVPELPSFDALFALTRTRAQQVWKRAGVKLAAESEAEPAPKARNLLERDAIDPTLHAADAQWASKRTTAAQLRAASLAWALRAASMVDELGVGDPVVSHALAVLALAEAATQRELPRQRALVAQAMGYSTAAAETAKDLADEDPVRHYANDDWSTLLGADAANAEHVLGVQALRAAGPSDERLSFATRLGDGAGSMPGLALQAQWKWGTSHAWRMALSGALALRDAAGRTVKLPGWAPGAVVPGETDLKRVVDVMQIASAELLPDIEASVASLQKKAGGPFFATDAIAAYHAAQALSAIDYIVSFHLDSLGAPERADHVLGAIGSGVGPLGKQLERYASHAIRAEKRTLPLEDLVEDVRELDRLGLGALFRLAEPVVKQGDYSRNADLLASVLARRCDSRVECRAVMSWLARRSLRDLVAEERLRASVLEAAPRHHGWLRLRQLAASRDRDAYVEALRDPTVSAGTRADYLFAKWSEWLEPKTIDVLAKRLLRDGGERYHVHRGYAEWQLDQDRPKQALATLDAYLRGKQEDHPLYPLAVHTLRARALQEMGQLDRAWDEVEPLVRSMYGPALTRAALIRSAQGKHEKATALAARMLERYQGPGAVQLSCRVHWVAGNDEKAAELLERWSNRLTVGDWHFRIGAAFEQAFAEQPAERAEAAMAAVLKRKVDPQGVRQMIAGGELPAQLAYRTYRQIPARGFERYLDVSRLYRYMREWKGGDEARSMLTRALAGQSPLPLSQHAYSANEFDLIWEAVPDPEADPHHAFVWLMRTAAYLRSDVDREARRQRLDAYYAGEGKEPHDLMGRYLLGMVDAAAMWRAAEGDARPEAAWVMGLKAELDGDFADATTWYRAVARGARANSGEAQWAATSLTRFRDSRKSLALLAAEHNRASP